MIWKELLGAIIRWLLVMLLNPLTNRGIISPELADRVLGEGTTQIITWLLMLVLFLWSIRDRIWQFVKIRIALDSVPGAQSELEFNKSVKAVSVKDKLQIALSKEPEPESYPKDES